MMSLVAYESSDEGSDSDASMENEKIEPKAAKTVENGNSEEFQDLPEKTPELHAKLPAPKSSSRLTEIVEEEDDEFLHKKAPAIAIPKNIIKKGPVKITIPSLSDFKEEKRDSKIPTVQPNKGSSLLNMLPRPKIGSITVVPEKQQQSISSEPPKPSISSANVTKKSNPLIPYALMNKNREETQKNPQKKKKSQKQEESDSDEDEGAVGGSFFSFGGDEKLPEISQNEINSMVAKKAAKMEEFMRKVNKEDEVEQEPEMDTAYQAGTSSDIDRTAFQALLGESKAKRTKLDEIQFVDLSAQEVMPDRDEWLRKTLRGETQFIPTGNFVEKGPNALAKRKHQISYLAMRAENNEAELEAMWASNRQTKRESKSKYGF